MTPNTTLARMPRVKAVNREESSSGLETADNRFEGQHGKETQDGD
jgi:hypothetical protein